ncbi:MAG TPA: hypothetical protein ENF77_05950 [Candidatus Acetothermia bacterium]|nr:hypothetical protein [Candidatus Acetothermia bacterium]
MKFTIDKKEFGFCATPITTAGCITVSPVFQMEGDKSHNQIDNKIGGVVIKEISLKCEFAECIEFSLDTVLYDLKSNALLVIDGPEGLVSYDFGAPYGTLYDCKPLTKYLAWEKAHFKFCGPGCCGGNFEVTMDLYFGKKYDVVWTIGGTAKQAEELPPGTQQALSCLPWTYSLTNEQQLGTLFGWMETDIAATVPVSADISLTLDLHTSFRGVEEIGVGFSFQF